MELSQQCTDDCARRPHAKHGCRRCTWTVTPLCTVMRNTILGRMMGCAICALFVLYYTTVCILYWPFTKIDPCKHEYPRPTLPNTVVFVPLRNISHRCAQKAYHASRGDASPIKRAALTTSDDLPLLRELLEARESQSQFRRATKGYNAFHHAPLCASRVIAVLRRWLSNGFATAEDEWHNVHFADGHSTIAHVVVRFGPLLRPWTFHDIALATVVDPHSQFIIVSNERPLKTLRREQRRFQYRCDAWRKKRGRSSILCGSAVLDLSDAERFIYVDCSLVS